MRIVLASGSPRRRELLSMIGIGEFEVIPDNSKEEMLPGLSPEQTVGGIALQKARNVSLLCASANATGGAGTAKHETLVIAADTLVYLDGRPLGKPDSPEGAEAMLRELSGRRHTVYTGVAMLLGGIQKTDVVATDVYFRDIQAAEISGYVKSGEPMDKAGAYAAQGRGSIFIERIEGEFFNVMGLPLCRLSMMLTELGIRSYL